MACTQVSPYLPRAVIIIKFFFLFLLFFLYFILVFKYKILDFALFRRRKLCLLFFFYNRIFRSNRAGRLDYLFLIIYIQGMLKRRLIALQSVKRYSAMSFDILAALLSKVAVQLFYKSVGSFFAVIFFNGSVVGVFVIII